MSFVFPALFFRGVYSEMEPGVFIWRIYNDMREREVSYRRSLEGDAYNTSLTSRVGGSHV